MSKGTNKNNGRVTVNTKVDADVKSKLDTLAYLYGKSLQDCCEKIFIDAINEKADLIEQAEKLREQV